MRVVIWTSRAALVMALLVGGAVSNAQWTMPPLLATPMDPNKCSSEAVWERVTEMWSWASRLRVEKPIRDGRRLEELWREDFTLQVKEIQRKARDEKLDSKALCLLLLEQQERSEGWLRVTYGLL